MDATTTDLQPSENSNGADSAIQAYRRVRRSVGGNEAISVQGTSEARVQQLPNRRAVRHDKRRRTKGAGMSHCKLFDGSMRYADKPFSLVKPRLYSPELLQFYRDEELLNTL